MSESELTKGLIDYLKQEGAATKSIAQSAIAMAQDNKLANETTKITMDNLKETLIDIKDFMKGVSQGYVTIKDFDDNKEQKKAEHLAMWERIKRLEGGFIAGAGFTLSSFLGLLIWYVFQK